MSQEQFHGFLKSVFANMCAVSDDGAMVYVAMSAQEWGTIMQAMKECAFHWSSTIIWAKDRLVLSRKDYHTRYEPIWYGWKEGSRLMPLTDRTQDDVWEIPRPSRSDEHPTMKPVELIVKSLQNSSRIGCNVLDLFNGSGSTAIACAKTGRNYYGMEIDPHYLDASLKRIRKWLSGRSVEFVMNRNGQAFEWPEEEAAAGEGGTV
jgi:DNA modification methylase